MDDEGGTIEAWSWWSVKDPYLTLIRLPIVSALLERKLVIYSNYLKKKKKESFELARPLWEGIGGQLFTLHVQSLVSSKVHNSKNNASDEGNQYLGNSHIHGKILCNPKNGMQISSQTHKMQMLSRFKQNAKLNVKYAKHLVVGREPRRHLSYHNATGQWDCGIFLFYFHFPSSQWTNIVWWSEMCTENKFCLKT